MSQRYVVSVVARKADRTFLVREMPSRGGLWCPPCGHVREGEGLARAAEREFLEETGMEVILYDWTDSRGYHAITKPIVVYEDPDRVGVAFTAESTGNIRQWSNPEEIAEIGWFSEQEIHELFFEGQLKHPGWNLRILVHRLAPIELVFLLAYDRGELPSFLGLDLDEAGCLIRNWHNLHHLQDVQ